MNDASPVAAAHRFTPADFIAGEAALDFVNTVVGRDGVPRDRLDSYAGLLDWAARAKLLPPASLRALTARSARDTSASAWALARAKRLREALFEIASSLARRRAPPPEALELLREHWLSGAEAHEFSLERGQLAPTIDPHADGLDLVAAIAAWRFVGQVLPHPPKRLRLCGGAGCAWLFLDTSRDGRRRWCGGARCTHAANPLLRPAKKRRTR